MNQPQPTNIHTGQTKNPLLFFDIGEIENMLRTSDTCFISFME